VTVTSEQIQARKREEDTIRMLTDVLNLSYVPRWTIVSMLRPQSVAEHSFRVATIVAALHNLLDFPSKLFYESTFYALTHDAHESYSSDLPSPFKTSIGRSHIHAAEEDYTYWRPEYSDQAKAISKLADVIEGYTWWQRHRDRNFQHPWINPDGSGPIECNLHTVINQCQITSEVLSRSVVDITYAAEVICRTIMGKELWTSDETKNKIKLFVFTRILSF
jgi:hypothetical protein